MVLYAAPPAYAVEEKVTDVGGGVDMRGGVVDAVESADEGVVSVGHIGGAVEAVVGCFRRAIFGRGRN